MNHPDIEPTRDHELATRLRALDAQVSPESVSALRSRILAAAAPRFAARARPLRLVSWVDVTSGVGRIAIPLSLAAALFAMVLLRGLPQSTVEAAVAEESTALAYAAVGDHEVAPQVTDELLLPENADAVLLAEPSTTSRP